MERASFLKALAVAPLATVVRPEETPPSSIIVGFESGMVDTDGTPVGPEPQVHIYLGPGLNPDDPKVKRMVAEAAGRYMQPVRVHRWGQTDRY